MSGNQLVSHALDVVMINPSRLAASGKKSAEPPAGRQISSRVMLSWGVVVVVVSAGWVHGESSQSMVGGAVECGGVEGRGRGGVGSSSTGANSESAGRGAAVSVGGRIGARKGR